MLPIKTDALEADGAKTLPTLMDDRQRQQFEADKDANFAVNPEGLDALRERFHQQRHGGYGHPADQFTYPDLQGVESAGTHL